MTIALPGTTIDPRKLLVSGGVGDGVTGRRSTRGEPTTSAPSAGPAEDTPSARDDWHVETLGVTWMRVP